MGTRITPLRLAPALLGASLSCLALAEPPDCDEALEWGVSRVMPARAIPGDLNADRVVDMQDVAEMMRLLTLPPNALSDAMRERADVNADARVDIDDLTALLVLIASVTPRDDCDPRLHCCHLPIAFGGCCGIPVDCMPSGNGDDDDLDGPGEGPGGIGDGGGGSGGGGGGGGPDPIGNPPGGGGGGDNPPDCSFVITPDFPYEKNNPPAQIPSIPFIGIDYLILLALEDVGVPAKGQIEWYLIIDGLENQAPDFGHIYSFQPTCLLSHYQVRAVSRKPDGTVCREIGPIDLTIHRAMPRSVTFGGANHTIHHDATGHAYDAPHWLDFDRDGQITAPPQSPPGATGVDRRFPIAYTRNTPMTIADFETHFSKDAFGGMPQPGDYTIKGTGSDGSIYMRGREGLTGVGSDPLPDHIAYLPNYSISWKISFDGTYLWYDLGTTTHEVYATLNDPADISPFRHSVYRISCGAGDGSSTVGEALATIWLPFQNRSVTSASGHTLGYYRHDPCGFNTPATDVEMLLRDTNGQCLAWTALFRDCLGIQGMTSTQIYAVYPLYESGAILPHPQCPDVTFQDFGFLIDNYTFAANGGSSNCLFYSYRFEHPCHLSPWTAHDVMRGPSQPGQDNPDPPSGFEQHFVVLVNSSLWYDPSYGIGPVFATEAVTFAALWRQTRLRGFYTFLANNQLPSQPFVVARQPPVNALDIVCAEHVP